MATERDDTPMTDDSDARLDDVARAVTAGEFFLVYQPTIDLQTNAFVGVEALLRWRHPARGVLGPDAFLPALEAGDGIIGVGAWVLSSACRQGADWHARGHRFTVSVNVAARQLRSPRSGRGRRARARREPLRRLATSCSSSRSTRTCRDAETSASLLESLRRVGVRLAIDDFGSRRGLRGARRHPPIDVVKIDRACISGLSTSPDAAARVHESRAARQVAPRPDRRPGHRGRRPAPPAAQSRTSTSARASSSRSPTRSTAIDRFLEDYAIFSGKPL